MERFFSDAFLRVLFHYFIFFVLNACTLRVTVIVSYICPYKYIYSADRLHIIDSECDEP